MLIVFPCIKELIYCQFFVAGSVYWILSTGFPPKDTFVDETTNGGDGDDILSGSSDDRISEKIEGAEQVKA